MRILYASPNGKGYGLSEFECTSYVINGSMLVLYKPTSAKGLHETLMPLLAEDAPSALGIMMVPGTVISIKESLSDGIQG